MISSVMTASTNWNVPYVFKGAKIVDDIYSWTGGQRLSDLFNDKLLSFRLGKRQTSLFGI